MNSIILMGRLTANPELKTTERGLEFCTFTVAVSRKTKDKDTDFIRCVAFDKTAVNIEKFFSKGSRILVRGSLQSEKWEKDGKKYESWKVIVIEFDFVENKTQTEAQTETPDAVTDDEEFPF